jgi:hypothetical protein
MTRGGQGLTKATHPPTRPPARPPVSPCSLGRKFWLVEASFQMMAAQVAMTAVITTQLVPGGSLPPAATLGLLVVVCLFIAGHAWGWGPMVSTLQCWALQPGLFRGC